VISRAHHSPKIDVCGYSAARENHPGSTHYSSTRESASIGTLAVPGRLNYAADRQNVSGIMVPNKRRVYPADAMMQKVAKPILVAIDPSHIEFEG